MVRASRHGTGYLSTAHDPAEFADEVGELRAICRSDRRDPAEIDIYLSAIASVSDRLIGADRAVLTGSPDQIAGDLLRYGRAGLDHLIITPDSGAPPDQRTSVLNSIETFATQILPAFGPASAMARS